MKKEVWGSAEVLADSAYCFHSVFAAHYLLFTSAQCFSACSEGISFISKYLWRQNQQGKLMDLNYRDLRGLDDPSKCTWSPALDPSPTDRVTSQCHHAFPHSPVLRLQVTDPLVAAGWGSCCGIISISAHLSPSGSVFPGHSAEQKPGSRRRTSDVKDHSGGRDSGWLTFSARFTCDDNTSAPYFTLGGGDDSLSGSRCSYWPWVSPESPIWRAQLNRDAFDCCWGGSGWKDGQMRRGDVSDRHDQLWQLGTDIRAQKLSDLTGCVGVSISVRDWKSAPNSQSPKLLPAAPHKSLTCKFHQTKPAENWEEVQILQPHFPVLVDAFRI